MTANEWRRTDFESEVLNDATWLDLMRIANEMAISSGDVHHRYLEGIEPTGRSGDITIAVLSMGS